MKRPNAPGDSYHLTGAYDTNRRLLGTGDGVWGGQGVPGGEAPPGRELIGAGVPTRGATHDITFPLVSVHGVEKRPDSSLTL